MPSRPSDLQQVDEPVKGVGPVELERDSELGDDLAQLRGQKMPNGALGGLRAPAKTAIERIDFLRGALSLLKRPSPARTVMAILPSTISVVNFPLDASMPATMYSVAT